jgi:hypothetical protein
VEGLPTDVEMRKSDLCASLRFLRLGAKFLVRFTNLLLTQSNCVESQA